MKTIAVLTALLCAAVFCGCAGEVTGGPNVADDFTGIGGHSLNAADNPAGETETGVLPDPEKKEEQPEPYFPPFPPPPRQELGTFPGLDAKTERQLKLDYVHWRPYLVTEGYVQPEYAVRILEYYGNYNGCEAVLIEGFADAQVVTKVVVAGMAFWFSSANVALVWKPGEIPASGRFYRLNEAYDGGVLTLEDVKSLHERHFDYPVTETESPPMPDHLCDFYGQKIPKPYCTDDNCQW